MKYRIEFYILATVLITGCAPVPRPNTRVPSMEYTNRLKQELAFAPAAARSNAAFKSPETVIGVGQQFETPRARFAADIPTEQAMEPVVDSAQQRPSSTESPLGFTEYRSAQGTPRDYTGPLSVGEPGLTASLWHESGASNDIYRDQRALQPMDLITVVVSETNKGQKQANTEVKEQNNVSASIDNLLGLEQTITEANPNIAMSNLIRAALQNNFKGEGTTKREGTLSARLSAMVVEVLPSGILRIEGEKIISMNGEDETMVISGLVRPRDINSENEVESAKIANLRVDFFGQGSLGEAQSGGWLSRLVRRVWPF
jgi:flagellar L-ring protein precursor FlgH